MASLDEDAFFITEKIIPPLNLCIGPPLPISSNTCLRSFVTYVTSSRYHSHILDKVT